MYLVTGLILIYALRKNLEKGKVCDILLLFVLTIAFVFYFVYQMITSHRGGDDCCFFIFFSLMCLVYLIFGFATFSLFC